MPQDTGAVTGSDTGQGKGAGTQAPAAKPNATRGQGGHKEAPASGPRQSEGAPAEHQSAFERAKARRGSGAPASDSPAAGLSTGKTAIQKTREGGKSAMEQLREKSRRFNPNAQTVDREIVADDAAMPGKGPSEVEDPEVEPLGPAPGEDEVPEESRVSTAVGDHDPGEAAAEVEEEQVTEEVFTPNLKYKAFGEERDIPERFHALITDAESEREVHEIFERSAGTERYRMGYQQLMNDMKQKLEPEIQFHRKTREDFNKLIQQGNIFGVLNKMGFSRQQYLQAAAQQVRLEQAPPEQRAQYEARLAAEARAEQVASRAQELETRLQQTEALVKHSAIQSTFARGDVRAVAEDFDSKMGRPGAFESLVRNHGALNYSQGRDLTPEQAVNEVMQQYGLRVPTSVTAPVRGAPARQQGAAAPAQNPQTKTRVLPNIPSRAAPTRSAIRVNNLDDVRRIRDERRGLRR